MANPFKGLRGIGLEVLEILGKRGGEMSCGIEEMRPIEVERMKKMRKDRIFDVVWSVFAVAVWSVLLFLVAFM